MKLGAAYPSTEVCGDPDAVRRFVGAIGSLGYDYIMVPDHVVKAPLDNRTPPLSGPYTDKDSFHDAFVLMAFCAALTDTMEFSTGVLILPQRQTVLVAQQSADIDLLTRQRFRLGVGIGWNHIEYTALGQDFRTRARRIEEQIGLLRQLWSDPLVTFEGSFDRIDRAGINPRPRRQIPIWLGGYSEPAYERASRLADGFVFAAGDNALDALARLRHHLALTGRSSVHFGLELLTQFSTTAQQAADLLQRWRDAGGTHGAVPSTAKGLGSNIEAHIAFFAELAHLVPREIVTPAT